MANVLKKVTVGNPLYNLGIRKELKRYDKAQTDEEIADFYHFILNKYGHRPMVRRFVYAMIDFSTNRENPFNPESLLQ